MCFKTKFLVILLSSLCMMWSCGEEEDTVDTNTDPMGGMTNPDPMGGSSNSDSMGNMETETGWGGDCQEDADCSGATNLCVKSPLNPPEMPGYCSIPCSATPDCEGSGAEWTCNVIGSCAEPIATWCGPASEIEVGMGVVQACE